MSVDRYLSDFAEGRWEEACAESWSDGWAAARVQRGGFASAETSRG